jgi:hypothetical protein
MQENLQGFYIYVISNVITVTAFELIPYAANTT